jgi:membrane protein YqaA with SNARE-associated domain
MVKKVHIRKQHLIRLGILAAVVYGLLSVNYIVLTNPEALVALEQIGLFGLFILSVISGFNVVVPIPVSLLYPSFAALGYGPVLIISIISIGMTLGDVVGFILGKTMEDSVLATKQGKKITHLAESYPKYVVGITFLYAMLMPLPNELIVMPLAALGISWKKVLIPVLIGNALFSMMLAFGAIRVGTLFF